MIKNKTLEIKVIFKKYLKRLNIPSSQTNCCSRKYQRTIFENNSQKLFNFENIPKFFPCFTQF